MEQEAPAAAAFSPTLQQLKDALLKAGVPADQLADTVTPLISMSAHYKLGVVPELLSKVPGYLQQRVSTGVPQPLAPKAAAGYIDRIKRLEVQQRRNGWYECMSC